MGHLPPWYLNANLSKPEKDIQTELYSVIAPNFKKASIVKVQLVQDKLAFSLFFRKQFQHYQTISYEHIITI